MAERGKYTGLKRNEREQIVLDTIIDAILDRESDLVLASPDQWKKILTDSCRRQKEDVVARRSLLAA